MGRNKYPEQTKDNILKTATKLFMEKGYDQTSVQDILNELKLSKGGLYHHYKSKEEILEAVMQKRAEYVSLLLQETIEKIQAKNAKEKLKKILYHLATDKETHDLDIILTTHINPYFVVNGMQSCMEYDAPIISQLIEEGNQDGSLKVENPEFCSEIFLMLLNYWANPILFHRDQEETNKRIRYFQSLMNYLGFDIIDDELLSVLTPYYYLS
ncbi:MAG: TetR/AcrR family transcriptional regulator [Firmicutes bacterium]|nr:TetR/AcrR family transcriptional regulator [Bacillota bacterium]